jgi:hypothetical protein
MDKDLSDIAQSEWIPVAPPDRHGGNTHVVGKCWANAVPDLLSLRHDLGT